LVDYLSWLPRMLRKRHRLPQGFFAEGSPPTYLLALQLQSDYQIRGNSPYRHLSQMLDQVVQSFARHAPEKSRLLIKQHPLDNDLEAWHKVVAKVAARYRVSDRLFFIEEGELGGILRHSCGVIVVNSTTGIQSLRASLPTIALGAAIYDIPGLTHQGGIDTFWRTPDRIDRQLLAAFIRALAGAIQVKGNFYHAEGRVLAKEAIVARIASGQVNEPDAYVERPPRLAWKRMPMKEERRQASGSLLPGGLDLPGKEIFGGQSDKAFSMARAIDMGDSLTGKFR
jgi:capsular polysaccharide export protein